MSGSSSPHPPHPPQSPSEEEGGTPGLGGLGGFPLLLTLREDGIETLSDWLRLACRAEHVWEGCASRPRLKVGLQNESV